MLPLPAGVPSNSSAANLIYQAQSTRMVVQNSPELSATEIFTMQGIA